MLDRVSVGRPRTLNHQVSLIQSLSINTPPFLAMVCVDSVISLYRSAIRGKSTSGGGDAGDAEGGAKKLLRKTMELLSALSKKGVRVCIVNEATADFSNPAQNSFKPVGGNRITKFLTCRLRLKGKPRASCHRRAARLGSDGRLISEDEFEIRKEGICGVGD